MKSTLADIKQLFNVKAIAYNTNINALAEGQFGVFPEDSEVSVVSGTTYDTLPAKFRIVSKLGGKIYYSFDTIDKTKIKDAVAKAYVAEQVNIWEAVIESCKCIDGIQLNVGVDEQSLIQRDGLTWTHRDFAVIVSPEELQCACSCDGTAPVYENNVYTQLLVEKINSSNSPFYTASARVAITGATTYANMTALNGVTGMEAGDMAIVTGQPAASRLYIYSGTAWVSIGSSTGVITDFDAFIAANKAVNTDDDTTNDSLNLTFVLTSKPMTAPNYSTIDVNYVYPRGVKLSPSLIVNDGQTTNPFTQTQALRYEIGAGYDLRAEEWANINYYTDLNYYTRLSDGIYSPGLVYQFDNATNYNTITFEFGSKKSGLEDVFEGNYKKYGVLLGTSDGTIFTALTAMFVDPDTV